MKKIYQTIRVCFNARPFGLCLLLLSFLWIAFTGCFQEQAGCDAESSSPASISIVYQTKPYAINTNHLDVYPVAPAGAPRGWTPDLVADLNEALPIPWPEKYLTLFKQPFAPWSFFQNASMLHAYHQETEDERALVLMERLLDRFLEYTLEEDGKLFVLYHFPKPYRGIEVQVPWTSAYASGAALIGLTLLNESLQCQNIWQLQDKIVAAMGDPIDTRQPRPRYWVSFVDPRGYLWFEEMPLDREEQPRILNGHIRALSGLYFHYVFNRDPKVLDLLRAGICTVEEYAMQYRREGMINAYDMLDPYIADYGPKRTVKQQHVLHKMTGEPVFLEYANIFEKDMRHHITSK